MLNFMMIGVELIHLISIVERCGVLNVHMKEMFIVVALVGMGSILLVAQGIIVL